MNAPLQRALWLSLFPLGLLAGESATLSLEDRIARLERQLARIEARLGPSERTEALAPVRSELAELGRPSLAREPVPPAVASAAEKKITVGGHLQLQSEFGDAPDARYVGIHNRILLRRARLVVRGSAGDALEFLVQPDFGNNGVTANSSNHGVLTDAYLAWTKFPAANFRLGQFKTPFGYEQLLPDTGAPTAERSFANDMLTLGRQIGVAVSGTSPGRAFTYSAGAFNGNGVNNGDNDNDQFLYAGRVAATAWSHGTGRLSFGTNGYWSRDSGAVAGHRTGFGVDAQLALGRFSLAGEYLRQRATRATGPVVSAAGWTALAGWFVLPATLQAVVRYETFDANLDVGGQSTPAWVFGANYLLRGEELKLVFNYTLGDPSGPAPRAGRWIGRLQVLF